MTNVTFMLSYFNLLLFIIFKRIVGKTANINMDEMHKSRKQTLLVCLKSYIARCY